MHSEFRSLPSRAREEAVKPVKPVCIVFAPNPNFQQRIQRAFSFLMLASFILVGCATAQRPAPRLLTDSVRFPAEPDAPRIVYLTTLEEAIGDESPQTSLERFLFGEDPSLRSTITIPYGLATHGHRVWVCDTQQDCVHVFDAERGQRWKLGGGHDGAGKPIDVAVADDGSVYVADVGKDAVVVFDAQSRFVRLITPPEAESFKPVSVEVEGDRLYAADAAAAQVHVFDRTEGTLLASIGGRGTDPGQFHSPSGVSVTSQGDLLVTDAILARVQRFGPDGSYQSGFGQPGQMAGSMARPRRLNVGPDGIIYVADALFNRVHMFDDQGRILMLFGSPEPTPGNTRLAADVCTSTELFPYFRPWIPRDFEAEYLVLVSHQQGGAGVNVYAFGHRADQAPAE